AKDPETIGTVVILDKDNKAFDLTMKAVRVMKALGRPTLVFTDADASLFPEGVEVIQIPTTEYTWAKPIMQYSPIGFLCGYIKEMRGASFYRYGGENEPYKRTVEGDFGEAISNQPLVLVK
ncbi:MAG: hypothetical protein IKD62_03270, partial [Oscillospiraceae bacterium]|nr:hypothetical protein [Oscillospiraceae bacterium]